jgi:hypothetical protein
MTLLGNVYINNVTAEIRSDAEVYAQSLLISAETNINDIAIAPVMAAPLPIIGGGAAKVGISGSVSSVNIINRTIAAIHGGVTITTGDQVIEGLDATIMVRAVDNSSIVNIAGGVSQGQNVGAGLTAAANVVVRDTRATIGDAEVQGNTVEITSEGNVEVEAKNEGGVLGVSLAGAKQDSPGQPPGKVAQFFTKAKDFVKNKWQGAKDSVKKGWQKFLDTEVYKRVYKGFEGKVTIGDVLDLTKDGLTALAKLPKELILEPINDLIVNPLKELGAAIVAPFKKLGAAIIAPVKKLGTAIGKKITDTFNQSKFGKRYRNIQAIKKLPDPPKKEKTAPKWLSQSSLAAAIDVSTNVVVDNTGAVIQNTEILDAKDVSVHAANSTWSTTVAGAGVMASAYKDKDAGPIGGLAGAASFATTVFVGSTDARIDSSTLSVSGDVGVNTETTSVFVTVGASLAKASSERKSDQGGADQPESTPPPGGKWTIIRLDPKYGETGPPGGGSGGGTGGGKDSTDISIGAVGSGALNVVVHSPSASVSNSEITSTAGSLTLGANNLSVIQSVAGSGIIEKGSAGIGASAATNIVIGDTEAYIVDSDVDVLGSVTLAATNKKFIGAQALTGTFTEGYLAVPFSLSTNVIVGDTRSLISSTASDYNHSITAGGDISLQANDTSIIWGVAGSIGVSWQKKGDEGDDDKWSAAGGAAFSTNVVIGDVVTAVEGSAIDLTLSGSSSGNVDEEDSDIIDFGADHELETGDGLIYNSDGEEEIGGLKNGETYYVIKVDETKIRLAHEAQTATWIGITSPVDTVSPHSFRRPDNLVLASGKDMKLNANRGAVIANVTAAGSGAKTAALGGAGSVTVVVSNLESLIKNATVSAVGDLNLDATDRAVIGTIALAGQLAVSSKDKKSAALGGAVGVNVVVGSQKSYLENTSVNDGTGTGNKVSLTATNESINGNVVLGGQGAFREESASIGGSFAVTTVVNATESYIKGSTVRTLDDDISLSATDRSITGAGAGSFQWAGTAAVGAAVAVNTVVRSTSATVMKR